MGQRLSNGNAAVALLGNSLATGGMLGVLIVIFSPISGAHFNPLVTLLTLKDDGMTVACAGGYLTAQLLGAIAGVTTANLMFGLAPAAMSHQARNGGAQIFSECVATFGFILAILVCRTFQAGRLPYVVAAYVTSAYWFAASTSFANPAVTLARSFTDTFSGIRLSDAPAFIVAQLCGGVAATFVFRLLVRRNGRLISEGTS